MTPITLARKYMDAFFGQAPLDSLDELLDENLDFEGPFYSFNSSSAYIESLKAHPPVGVSYSIVNAFEDEDAACLIYHFRKAGVSALMVQYFEVANGKIKKNRLVFDSKEFA